MVLYLLFLHHSQTVLICWNVNQMVWYLLLLHHSQTHYLHKNITKSFGTFCFYIILKLDKPCLLSIFLFGIFCFYIILKLINHLLLIRSGLVSSAFTSFSNITRELMYVNLVWYLLLLHHSQTLSPVSHKVGLVWFLLLLHHSQTQLDIIQLELTFGSFCFYIILKLIAYCLH